jgi:radical SAM superfamily enzyme YgiQ (UPF0313 family)
LYILPSERKPFIIRNSNIVISELQWIVRHYSYFEFFDTNVLNNPIFSEIVTYIPHGIYWGALIDINPDKIDLLRNMYVYGCRNIYVGLETFNNSDLNYLNKLYALKNLDAQLFLKELKDIGFNIGVFLIRGLPHEQIGELDGVIQWVENMGMYPIISRYLTPKGFVRSTKTLSKEYLETVWDRDLQISEESKKKILSNVLV